jgi:hypothetical protein
MPALIQTEDAAAITVSETVEEGLDVRMERCEDGSCLIIRGQTSYHWFLPESYSLRLTLAPRKPNGCLEVVPEFPTVQHASCDHVLKLAWTAKILQGHFRIPGKSPSHQQGSQIAGDHQCERPFLSFADAKTVHVGSTSTRLDP